VFQRRRTLNPASENRLAFLDSLRGIAAAWVVFYHMIFIPVPNVVAPGWAQPWAAIGGVGVTLFFIVSAFSLCYTMPFHQRERRPLRSFYLRRLFRIAPLLYVMLAVTLLRDKFVSGEPHDLASIAESMLFVFNLVPGNQAGIVWASWTVGVEMLFYLFFPLLYLWTGDVYRACLFFLISVAAASAFKLVLDRYAAGAGDYFQLSVLRHLPIFALGIAAFRFYERFSQRGNIARNLALLVVAMVLFQGSAMIFETFFHERYYFQGPWFVAALLGLAIFPVPIIVNRLTRFLGKLSYSLYLIHPPLILALIPAYRQVYGWALPLSLKYIIVVVLTFGLLITLAWLAYTLVEAPGIRFGKRISLDGQPVPVRQAATPSST
jgi:peptidoglycan/LPS O-acetylase OafA/YrhL